LLEDEEFSRQVEEAEFALVEDYADGTLPAEELAIVSPWITGSPERRSKAAITAALRASAINASTIHIATRRIVPVWFWAFAAAACIALLATLPLLRRKQPEPVIVAQLSPPPVAQPQSIGEDTILLEAQHLRGADESPRNPVNYVLHADAPTRIQIIVPSSAPRGQYSVDLRQAPAQRTSAPVHLDGLPVTQKNNLSYVEFVLPAGSLSEGLYESDLQLAGTTYRVRFSVGFSGSRSPAR
jgi:hypothetical protein